MSANSMSYWHRRTISGWSPVVLGFAMVKEKIMMVMMVVMMVVMTMEVKKMVMMMMVMMMTDA